MSSVRQVKQWLC